MYIYTSLAHGARVLRRVRAPSASSSALANACRAPRVAPVCVCVCRVCVVCVSGLCVCVLCVLFVCVYIHTHTLTHTHTHTHTRTHTLARTRTHTSSMRRCWYSTNCHASMATRIRRRASLATASSHCRGYNIWASSKSRHQHPITSQSSALLLTSISSPAARLVIARRHSRTTCLLP